MSGVGFRATIGETTTGTALKTMVQIVAAANHGVLITEIGISFKGTSNTDAPILVQVARQSTAGTMSALTPVKDPDDTDETLQTTAQQAASAEPTTGNVLMAELVHPQTGWNWQARFGEEIKISGGDRLGIRVTAGSAVNAVVTVKGNE